MNENLKQILKESLHNIRGYLSPVATFIMVNDDFQNDEIRKLGDIAKQSLILINKELDRLNQIES